MKDTQYIRVSNAPSEREIPAPIDRYYPFEYWGYSVSTIPHTTEEETSDAEILRYMENAGQFDFWKSSEEDVYTIEDGEELK